MKPSIFSRIGATGGLAIALAALVASASKAQAHPHVWVKVQSEVSYSDGKVSAIRHRWTFDDMYTAMAIQGLDRDRDGVYTREELKELAEVNIESLKEFDYFTFAKSGETKLPLKPPEEYWLEHKDGILSLHFTMPLTKPVPATSTEAFSFQVYDPSYFIAFDFAKDEPVRLARGAPAGCGLDVRVPQADVEQAQDLSDAFLSQFDGDFGLTLAKTVKVTCAQS